MSNIMKELLQIKEEIEKEQDMRLRRRLQELEKKIRRMRSKPMAKGKNQLAQSLVVQKRKKEIIDILSKSGKITSYELSLILNISRTRCNEYLKELERDGIAKSQLSDKKMYYELRG